MPPPIAAPRLKTGGASGIVAAPQRCAREAGHPAAGARVSDTERRSELGFLKKRRFETTPITGSASCGVE